MNQVMCGNCLEVMQDIASGTVSMVLCDLPYGITNCKWDTPIDLNLLWTEYWRVCKPTAVVALNASQPFTSVLVMSQIEHFKHEWIWLKNRGSNFANTVREPMKEHESVLIFSKGRWIYNKQMQERSGSGSARTKYLLNYRSKTDNYHKFEGKSKQRLSKLRVPSSWQKFNTDTSGLHPTIKPVELFQYLIRTYTNKGDLVLDSCAGSGTTAVAAIKENRRFMCIEQNQEYVDVACSRIHNELKNHKTSDLF